MALLAQVSTQQLITKSISTLTLNVSSITGVAIGTVQPTDLTSTIQGLANIGYISTSQLVSTVAGIGSGFTGSTSFLSAATINTSSFFANSISVSSIQSLSSLTSSLTVNGTGVLKANGTNSASLYGAGVDTLTLQTSCNAYRGGIASLAFGVSNTAYPLGRIYALDSAASGSPISQLVFQTVPISPTSFNSNYSYTGANQTFTVPAGVTSMQVSLWGAGGAYDNYIGYGGAGAFVQGILTVTPGQVYTIVVGQGGALQGSPTYGGGGGAIGYGTGWTAAGGGRSALMLNVTVTITGATGSGSAITYTTSGSHNLITGQPVVISGLSPSGFNGTYVIYSTPAGNQFTVLSSQTGSSTGTGSILAEVVDAGGGGAAGYYGNGGYATYSGTAASGVGTGGGYGGSQTGGGSIPIVPGYNGLGTGTSGTVFQGGYAGNYGGGGGGGYYGGGGGGNNGNGTGGGGGSSYTSYTTFTLTLGLNSPNSANQAPGQSITGYVSGVAAGSTSGTGGNGLVLIASIGGSITEAMRIGSNSYVGIGTTTPSYPLDVAGNARMSNVYLGTNSTLITQQFYGLFGNYNNTVLAEISTGGGSQELLVFRGSSASDRVRVQTTGNFVVETGVSARLWSTNTAITGSNLTPALIINTSSNVGIQTANPGATLDVAGTGRFQNLSTLNISLSTINGQVYTAGGGSGSVPFISALTVSTSFLNVSSMSAIILNVSTTATISSLIVNSLQFGDGTGWVNLGPLQAVAVSSIQENTNALYANNVYIGNTSTVNAIQYNGLFGNYTNTVLGEISTGAGTQEFLVFKGSSTSDRIRMQTTGNFVVETGVSARLWNSNTTQTLSNATPAFLINTSSNVGIQTANPATTLDVAGTGRFQLTSTLGLNISSINGAAYTPGITSLPNVISSFSLLTSSFFASTSQIIVTSTQQLLASSIQASFIQAPFISTQQLQASTILTGLMSTAGFTASTVFTPFAYNLSTLTSTLLVNGSEIIKYTGSASASLYGYGTDTLTLQYTSNNYTGAVASLAFAGSAASYPLARIYALDSAVSGSPISQLIFQNTPTSATSFSSNFNYTGADQTFTVPTGVTSMQVTLWGAGGAGGYNGGGGGAGAFVQGVLTVTPGQTYTIVVGQGGVMNSASTTYGGGGGSGGGSPGGSSGGGRSAILLNLTVTISSASGSGSAITYTTSAAHGLLLGQPVVISGLSPSGFNGSFAVASIPASNQFTVVSTQTGSSTGTGAIKAEVVNAGGGGSGGYNGGLGGAAQFSGTALNAPDNGVFRGGKGGTQTAGGAGGAGSTWNGSILQGGLGLTLGGGGGGGFYGGGGGEWSPGGAAGGGGGSTYTSHTSFALSIGLNSPNSGTQAPGTSITGYVSGVAVGGPATQTTSSGNGGNGLILLNSIGGNMAEAMRINTSGYLGIGTTSPAYLLDVAGNARMSNAYLGTNSTLITQQFYGLFGNYNNTVLAEISTGGGSQELLVFRGSSASDRVRVQTTGNFVVETGVSSRLWSTNTAITASNLTPAFIINTSSNVGIQTASPAATLDVAGTGRFQTLSTLALNISSINGTIYTAGGGGGITTANLQSTVGGLGQIYLSTATGGASGPVPFISAFTVSTGFINVSSISAITMNVSTTATISSMTTNAVTLGTTSGWLLTSPIQTVAISTNTFYADQSYVNTETVTTGLISTLTTNAITLGSGSSWVLAGPLQTSIVSSIYSFASQPYFDTVNVGSVSTMNSLEYYGLFGNYNNTVLAEVSTGAGSQELLVFKGSSVSDRVRIQTTGGFVVETGVSARLFNSNTTQTLSNATPAFIVNSSSNVGIQTASPGATLDVAGSGRFLTLSSLQMFTSSIVAPYTFQPQFFTF